LLCDVIPLQILAFLVGLKSPGKIARSVAMSTPYNNDPAAQPRPVVPAQKARQGVTGHNVRYVLGFSVAAIVIVFAIIWLVYFG
jgi:hypothetical protein